MNGSCPDSTFLGFPTWYKYLDCTAEADGSLSITLNALTDVWRIVGAITEIVVYIGGVSAVFIIVWGGIQYIMSQGDPGKITQAKSTIQNAAIGLIIAILATVIVRFIGNSLTAGDIV